MGRSLFATVILALNLTAFAQSTSPEALFERGMDAISGVGPSCNDQEALEYFRRSADLGYGPSQVVLGYFYETGRLTAGSQSQAADWYKKAALQGDSLGQYLLGRTYFLGGGISQDLNQAQKWLQAASDQGSPFATYYLGRLMADKDYTKAPAFYKAAADQGIPAAQFYYAKALKDGRGVPQNRFNAYVWFIISQDAGQSRAVTELAELEGNGSLTTAQISDAKGQARNLEQTVIRAVNAKGCTGWEGEFDDYPTAPPPNLQRFCR